jgi:2-polyprenyl-3-methyl-5-hydroxy-6-metoxy-1,4-benzoquinol methylase
MENTARAGQDSLAFRRRSDCPICGSSELKDKYLVNGFTVAVCCACDQTFIREIVPKDELAQFYTSSEGDQVYWDPDNEANLNFYDHLLKRSIEELKPAGRILDIGCERGRFLDVMAGWERHGVEIVPALASIARDRYGERVHAGTLDDYVGPPGYFDVVTLLDALDHMPDPRTVIAKCRSLLVAGGLLVVKVHNISCLYARLSGSRFYAIIPPFHLYYFNPRTLKELLKSERLKPIAIRFFPHRLSIRNILFRLARGSESNLAYRMYCFLEERRLGRLTIRKNLRDIMTVFAVKE